MGKKLVVLLITLMMLMALVIGCSTVAPYKAPSKKDVSGALDGGKWIDALPAPQFIELMDNRYYDTMEEVAVIEFYDVLRDDVVSYVKELESQKFKVTNIVEYFEGNEDLAKKQKKAKYYNAYLAEKGSLRLDIDMEAYNDHVVQFKISGVSNDELSQMHIEADGDGYGGNHEMVEAYLKVDANKEINQKKQKKNVNQPDYWYFDLPAPAFGQKEVEHYPSNVGQTMVFEGVTSKELNAYLATLEDADYKIEKAIGYMVNEGVKENSYLFAENRNNLDRAKKDLDEEFYHYILASKDEVIIRFDVMSAFNNDPFKIEYDRLVLEIIGVMEQQGW